MFPTCFFKHVRNKCGARPTIIKQSPKTQLKSCPIDLKSKDKPYSQGPTPSPDSRTSNFIPNFNLFDQQVHKLEAFSIPRRRRRRSEQFVLREQAPVQSRAQGLH